MSAVNFLTRKISRAKTLERRRVTSFEASLGNIYEEFERDMGRTRRSIFDRGHTSFEEIFTAFENEAFEKEMRCTGGWTIDFDDTCPLRSPISPADDPNIVDWDSPDDAQNPMNWSALRKNCTLAIVSGITLLSPLGSSFIAPAVPEILNEVRLFLISPWIDLTVLLSSAQQVRYFLG